MHLQGPTTLVLPLLTVGQGQGHGGVRGWAVSRAHAWIRRGPSGLQSTVRGLLLGLTSSLWLLQPPRFPFAFLSLAQRLVP